MRRLIVSFLVLSLSFLDVSPAFPKGASAQTQEIGGGIQTTLYRYKKTRQFIAVELGFTNTTGGYVDFTPKEIYLDDEAKYSSPPLSVDKLQQINLNSGSEASMVPAILGVGLGIGALAAGVSGHNGAANGLGIAALGMGGAFILSKGLEDASQQKKLVAFESNSFGDIKRLPPGMTLGGWLYFPTTKKEKSVTVVVKSKGGYKHVVFPLSGMRHH
jgi:hypothetical protein